MILQTVHYIIMNHIWVLYTEITWIQFAEIYITNKGQP